MASGHDLVRAVLVEAGVPYSQRNPQRYSLDSGEADCSGAIVKGFVRLHLEVFGYVSTTLESNAIRAGGRYISRQEALWTPGAGCGIWGSGSKGHIEISAGDGLHTVGTPGANHRLGVNAFDRNRWGEFWLWPNIDHGAPAGGPPPPSSTRKATHAMLLQLNGPVKVPGLLKDGIYLLGVGFARYIPKPADVKMLNAVNVGGPAQVDELHFIEWCQIWGAWDSVARKPRLVP